MQRAMPLVLCLLLAVPCAAAPPSEASLKRLLEISGARAAVEMGPAQIDALAQEIFTNILGDHPLTPEQKVLFDRMVEEMVVVVSDELAWAKLEPRFLEIYAELFEQNEVDGMIAFYESEAGRAMARKLPVVQARAMRISADMQMHVLPRIQEIAARYAGKLAAPHQHAPPK